MSVPSMMIEPLSGLSRPIRVFSRTDLPVPEGPSITQISPAGMSRVTSPQISCLPKLLVRLLILISTPIAHVSLCLSWTTAGHTTGEYDLVTPHEAHNVAVSAKLRGLVSPVTPVHPVCVAA